MQQSTPQEVMERLLRDYFKSTRTISGDINV